MADLLGDRRLVARKLGREVRHLGPDHRAEPEDDPERQQDGQDHRRDPGNPELAQAHDEGREDEAQEDRQSDGDQDLAADIEGGDDDDGDEEGRHRRRRRGAGGGDRVLEALGGCFLQSHSGSAAEKRQQSTPSLRI
jgi:hypothetical protein